MSNVFDFPFGNRAKPDAPFLREGDLVQFEEVCGEGAPADACTAERSDSGKSPQPGDWGNQELASIYRVQRLLGGAGFLTTIERGLSDEGEPWCVLCREDGEVFVHLCRIDGMYLLDSAQLERPLVGETFMDLIEAFSGGTVGGQGRRHQTRGRLVKLDRDGNVFLHPATMLAALIWTLYLRSEDLVLVQIDPSDTGADAIADLETAWRDPGAEAIDQAGIDETDALPTESEVAGEAAGWLEARPAATDGGGTVRDIVSKALVPAPFTGVAAGLSTIAIACGFMAEGFDPAEDAPDLAEIDAAAGSERGPEEPGTSEVAGGPAPVTLATVLEGLMGSVLADAASEADGAAVKTATRPAVPEAGFPVPDGALAEAFMLVPGDAAPDRAEAASEPGSTGEAVVSGRDAPIVPGWFAEDADGATDPMIAFVSIDDVREFVPFDFRAMTIGEYVVEATFDVARLSASDTSVLDAALALVGGPDGHRGEGDPGQEYGAAPEAGAGDADGDAPGLGDSLAGRDDGAVDLGLSFSQRPGSRAETGDAFGPSVTARQDHSQAHLEVRELDDRANEFIHYLLNRPEEVLRIAPKDQDRLIYVDLTVESPGIANVMHWELSHGGIITTIGNIEDYQAYFLA
jgi:hypothetical protein